MSHLSRALLACAFAIAIVSPVHAQKKYGPGATDTEIKLGQNMPYSGPASAYGAIGKAELAYFKMINEQGGINGRKLKLIIEDQAYQVPKAVQACNKLINRDKVFAFVAPLGTPAGMTGRPLVRT